MTHVVYGIGQASKLAGCSIATIRYYEDKRLLPNAPRTVSGRRQFDKGLIEQIKFIRSMRKAGLTLSDIRKFDSLRRDAKSECSSLVSFATQKAKAIRAQIAALRVAEARLSQFANACTDSCADTKSNACKVTLALTA